LVVRDVIEDTDCSGETERRAAEGSAEPNNTVEKGVWKVGKCPRSWESEGRK
jgi:hypothetical protein